MMMHIILYIDMINRTFARCHKLTSFIRLHYTFKQLLKEEECAVIPIYFRVADGKTILINYCSSIT